MAIKDFQKKSFLRSSENINATYSFTEIVTTTGYIEAYGTKTATYSLSTFQIYPRDYSEVGTEATGAATKVLDLDFDIIINKPLTLLGKAVINVPMILMNSNVNNVTGHLVAKLRKYSGGVESEIASSGNGQTVTGNNSRTQLVECLEITVPITIFKKGDYLRVTIEAWVDGHAASTVSIEILYDPIDRRTLVPKSGGTWNILLTTSLKAYIPVRIDF